MVDQSDSRKIHVLYIPKWYPNKYDPMPGLFIKRHAETLVGLCEVSLLYVHAEDQLDVNLSTIIKTDEDGIRTWRIYFRKSKCRIISIARLINLLKYFYFNFKGIRLISKTYRKPDLVHVNVLTRLGFVAWIYQVFTFTPYIITEHWTRYLPQVNSFKGKLRKQLTKMVVRYAKAVMPVTANLKNAMLTHGLKNKNYRIVPNVVDTDLFTPRVKTKNPSPLKLIHLSCFTNEQKNISSILRVIKKLTAIRQDFELYFVGDGKDFKKMKQISDDCKLTDKFVFFTGLLEGEQLVNAISSADLMIMFSHYENLPVVILESFACGVPVISSKVGGIHEHLHADKGALVEARNEDQFLKTLNHTLDQLNQFDKKTIREYALDHFSREIIGKQLYDIYSSATKRLS